MLGNGKKNIGYESSSYKSGGNSTPIVYTHTVFIACYITETIYSTSSILNIGSYIYLDVNLTNPYEWVGISLYPWPSDYEYTGFTSDINGLIINQTAEIGGC